MAPDEWVTDKNPAYGAALRELKLTGVPHTRRKRANNRAESSHLPVRRRERNLQGFKTPRSAQRFLSLHAATYNVFTVPRHLVSARTGSVEPRRLRRGEMRPVSRPDISRCATRRACARQRDNAVTTTYSPSTAAAASAHFSPSTIRTGAFGRSARRSRPYSGRGSGHWL